MAIIGLIATVGAAVIAITPTLRDSSSPSSAPSPSASLPVIVSAPAVAAPTQVPTLSGHSSRTDSPDHSGSYSTSAGPPVSRDPSHAAEAQQAPPELEVNRVTAEYSDPDEMYNNLLDFQVQNAGNSTFVITDALISFSCTPTGGGIVADPYLPPSVKYSATLHSLAEVNYDVLLSEVIPPGQPDRFELILAFYPGVIATKDFGAECSVQVSLRFGNGALKSAGDENMNIP